MRVSCKRTGGFAGLRTSAVVDSGDLTPSQAQELKKLVEEAKLFDQPAKPARKSTPDQFQYEFTVEDRGRTHSFATNDVSASDELIELVDWLIDAASFINRKE
jgi:hypothetical protein